DRIDRLARKEFADLDGLRRLLFHRLQLFLGEEDVLALREFVALRGLLASDGLLLFRTEELLLDTAPARGVNHIEPDLLPGLGSRVELHRNRDEAEGDGTGRKRTRHLTLLFPESSALEVVQFNMLAREPLSGYLRRDPPYSARPRGHIRPDRGACRHRR